MAPEAGFEPADDGAARWNRILRELAELEARMARLAEAQTRRGQMRRGNQANAPGSRRIH